MRGLHKSKIGTALSMADASSRSVPPVAGAMLSALSLSRLASSRALRHKVAR
jgi:hypothetical protein